MDARLLQASTGVALWSQSFDSDVGDVFAVRNRITQRIVEQLGVKGAVSRRGYDLSPEAYGRYLTARALVSRRLYLGPQKAIEYFQEVIAMAPDFAPAYAGIADAYAHMSLPTYPGMPVSKAQGLMRTAALKALELDPDLAEAHAAMGIVSARDLDWPASQREFQQAIALNPSLSQVYTNYSFFTLRPLRQVRRSRATPQSRTEKRSALPRRVAGDGRSCTSQSGDTTRRSICCSACEPWIRNFLPPMSFSPEHSPVMAV